MTNYPQARYLWETRNTPAGVHLTGTLLQRMRETSETLFLVPLFFFCAVQVYRSAREIICSYEISFTHKYSVIDFKPVDA